jgi:RNA polymerase sigma-70 factor (ECF subfamily)
MAQLISAYSDNQLIELYQKTNNVDYIGELYKRYATLTYGLCFKYLLNEEDAKDAVTEIFEVLLEKLKTFEVTFFKSWLFIVAKNHLIKKKNKNNLLKTIELDESAKNNTEKFMENEPEMDLNIKEVKSERLQQALSNLNEEQRTCIDLFYYQQKPYQEVASITGYDLNKVKSAIQNGKRNLKLFMEEKEKRDGQ